LARQRGGPEVCFQLLEITELDDRLTTESMAEYTDTPIWNRPNAVWSWAHYLADIRGGDVPTELHAYPGTFHGSNLLTEAEVSRRGTADSVAAVVRALSG